LICRILSCKLLLLYILLFCYLHVFLWPCETIRQSSQHLDTCNSSNNFQLTGSNPIRFQLTTFTCNEVVLFALMMLFNSLLSFTSPYFRYLFRHNIAYVLRDNCYSCWKLSLQVVTSLCIFDEFKVKKDILIWCGIEMSFVRMLTFGIQVSVDAH